MRFDQSEYLGKILMHGIMNIRQISPEKHEFLKYVMLIVLESLGKINEEFVPHCI